MACWIRLSAALVALSPGMAQADALEWLQRMNQAVSQTTYEGTAVYRDSREMRTLKILHRFEDGQETERMMSLSGEPREVLRKNNDVTCILPDQKSVVVDHKGLPGLLPKLSRTAFEDLGQTYDLILISQPQRVAGRACQPIEVRARDIYRYDYALCLDQQTAVPLDIRLLDQSGELLEQVIFTEIVFPAHIEESRLKPQQDLSGFAQLKSMPVLQSPPAAMETQGLWELPELPSGFRLATREQGQWPGFDSPVTQLLYSDGLASVSVFATEQKIPDDTLQGMRKLGGVNAYGRMIGDHHIMVIGEVPPATLRFFGDNLRLAHAQ